MSELNARVMYTCEYPWLPDYPVAICNGNTRGNNIRNISEDKYRIYAKPTDRSKHNGYALIPTFTGNYLPSRMIIIPKDSVEFSDDIEGDVIPVGRGTFEQVDKLLDAYRDFYELNSEKSLSNPFRYIETEELYSKVRISILINNVLYDIEDCYFNEDDSNWNEWGNLYIGKKSQWQLFGQVDVLPNTWSIVESEEQWKIVDTTNVLQKIYSMECL
jgi:hypothetical protein